MPAIASVLFVCAGNICRSPLAAARFRQVVASRPTLAHLDVGSAGVVALTGTPATPEAVAVADEAFGLDLTTHRARNVEGLDADLILAVDTWVWRELVALGLSGRIERFGDYAGAPGDVFDPYGGDAGTYRDCAAHIRDLVESVADRMEREAGTPDGRRC
jgi:protein-tyrosine phosphatase